MVLGRNARAFLSSEARNYSEIYKLIDRKSPFLVVLRSYRTVDHILSCRLVEIRILRQNLGLETIAPDVYVMGVICARACLPSLKMRAFARTLVRTLRG